MPPDEDGGGQGQGLAMLRLEARRYKREMQQIWMQRELHEKKKSAASFSSEDSSRIPDGWRFSETFTTSPATSGTPMFWNGEDVAVSHLEQLAIVEEGTQTDTPSKSEVQTETEKLQYDTDVVLNMEKSRTLSLAANDLPMLKTCSRHCDELRSRISQEAACECLADAAVRVNADVVFTAKPKRVAVETQVETPEYNYPTVFRPDEKGAVSQIPTIETSPSGSLNKGQKSTDPVQYFRTGLRGLVSPVPQHDSACSPIHNLHDYGARFRSLGDTSKDTTSADMFSWQQDRAEPERCLSFPPAIFSAQVSTPHPEASCGGMKAGDITSDFSTEISKRVRAELTGEGAMAARLATKIKHALEAIGGKADTRSTKSTFNLPGQGFQSISARRSPHKGDSHEKKLFEDAGETFEDSTFDNKEIASSDTSSLPLAGQHARRVPVSSSQKHSSNMPGSDADVYFQNVMAALSTDRYTSKKLSGRCTVEEVSPARAARRAERRAEAARRANVKSCGDHHTSHQPDGANNTVKKGVRQSGSNHVKEKQRLLSNVQKLQSVAETAKRLYTDIVDCAYDELRASTDCGNLVKHQDEDGARDVCKFAKPVNGFCPSMDKTSDKRRDVASTGNDEVCGRCHVCQPQIISRENHQECMGDTAPSTCRDSYPCDDFEQPSEEAQTDSLDEITIQLSGDSPTNITLSKNDCTKRPGYNVEIFTPYEPPCQRECSPNNRGENIVRRGSPSWKDSCKPAMRRTGSNHQVKICPKKCLLDPRCDGPRDSCHMPTRRCYSPTGAKCSGVSTVSVGQVPKKDSNKCLLDPCCDGPRDSCHMPTRSKCSGASTLCISQPMKDSNKCRLDPCSVGPRNRYRMPTRSKCSGASAVCISQPMEDSNMCHLDPCCIGSRNSCHMPTYAKSSRASCGPGGGSRLKRNNGTKLCNKDPSVLSRCPVHCRRGVRSTKGKLENDSCREKVRSARKVHSKVLDDENPGHTLLLERSPGRPCRDVSKFPKGRLDENSKVIPLSESRDLCMIHNDVQSSSMKGKENANGGLLILAEPRHSSGERMGPGKNVHRSFQQCSRIGGVRNHSTLTATDVIEKEHAFVGKETRQPPQGRYVIGNASGLFEAYTQSIKPHGPFSDHVDRAAAAAGLAKEIEVMIADQLSKSNRRIRESNYMMPRRKVPEVKNGSFGQSNLDAGIISAENAVKKLKPVSLLPVVKRDEGNHRVTPRKGPRSRAKLMSHDAIVNDFYEQMHKELEELASWRKQLFRKERAHFQSQFLLSPRQKRNRHVGFSVKRRSLSDLKNLANADSELEEARRSVRMQRSEEFSNFWDEPICSHTLGSKRLRSTSPARDHGNKLLRLNVGKAESQAGRMKKDQHPNTSAIRMSSSFGRWKPPPSKGQAKTTTKRKIFTTRKTRPPAWVERMSKAKDVFTSLLRPMLLAQSRKETQPKPTFRKRILRPPGLVFTSSVTSKQTFGKHIPGDSTLQPSLSRIMRKNPIAPIQYDINTGRKIVHSEREPGELLHTTMENQDVFPGFKSLDEKNIRITQRPIVKIGMISPAVANSSRYHLRVKGWNADPLIRSDIPHKPADIIRYNRNGGLDVQVRRRDGDGKHRTLTGTSVGQRNVRQVTFAGMVVHNSRNERRPKSLRDPHRSDSLRTQATNKKSISSQPRKVKSTLRKRRSSSVTKIQPMQDRDKLHRYGGGGGKWTYHEGFWTETFKSEKGSQDDSLQSLATPGSISQLGTPILELESDQVFDNETLNKPVERVGAEAVLTTMSLASAKTMDNEDEMGMAGEAIALEVDGNFQNSNLFKNLGSFGTDVLKDGEIIDHSSDVAMTRLVCPSRRNEEDERMKSCSKMESTIGAKKQVQVSKITSPSQERRKREPSCNVLPQSPLRLLDEVFPDSTENETLVSMFDHLQESSSVQIEAQSDELCPASECITRQEFLDTLAHEQEGKLKEIELERTLMDIVLHTILQDDPLQDQEVFPTRVEPISLPTNRRLCRVGVRADKEVEAIVHSHDMSQSPLSKVPCVDRSTEHDIVPHVDRATELDVVPRVDRATELDVVPHVDRATELDNSTLFSKDQDSQTTNVELLVPKDQRLTSPTQEECSAKSTHVHHQATECRAPWNTVGVQTPDTTATISTSLNPPAAMPMLMPVFFQQWGTSIFPAVLPTFHFELPATMATSSNVQPPPASAINPSLPTGVNQGTEANESHIQLNSKEIVIQAHHQVSKLPINSRVAREQLAVLEEESDSDWEELKEGSSPSTPSTPLSSPSHKTSLKKAMELYPVNSSIRETLFARKEPQPSTSEACQTLVSELAPPFQMVTETIIEDIAADEPPQTMTANETRRGTSWARVKEMEAATVALLRAASRKTPSATSSSEYSRESSPEFHTWISPGELNIEDVGRNRTGGRFLNNVYNTRAFHEDFIKPSQSNVRSSFGSGRASVGEIFSPVRFLGLLSEGEVEAGVVSTLDEPGQIQVGYNLVLHSRTDLQRQGSEPGEFHVDADASSPQQPSNSQIVP
ncbi:hypothetical protein M758_1G065500 [Ceratodon purpureus]|nr:hypothetical protein M758_1G065500 [Ceratodon purpureus]KAG0628954.1 hypothetical protein M758_1G065500 [Ceratodon purpureus]KAG0628956.1 hypothetical protein M758_1G065500 [Ceratodon purpureus]KAG0628957.1 hypothetical protein M758_1G065500 [Ceratodon purpureus]